MTKSDLSWVLVKFFGAILIYLGLANIYGGITTWFSMQDMLEGIPEPQKDVVNAPIRVLFIGSLLPLTIGSYLVFSGRILHDILTSVPSGSFDYTQVPGAIPGIELPEEELKQFKLWRKNHPEFNHRRPEDLVALFRDAQRSTTKENS